MSNSEIEFDVCFCVNPIVFFGNKKMKEYEDIFRCYLVRIKVSVSVSCSTFARSPAVAVANNGRGNSERGPHKNDRWVTRLCIHIYAEPV